MNTSSRIPIWRRYLRFWGQDPAADVDDELRFHLERRVEELTLTGLSPDEARRQALERFGNLDAVRRDCLQIDRGHLRQTERRRFRSDLAQDLGYAVRTLRRQPRPSLVIILCLALGIGAATTIVAIGDALLLRPPPFPNGDRLVRVGPATDLAPGRPSVSSFEDYADWVVHQRSFDALGALQSESYTLVDAETIRIPGASVTSGVFRALGTRPLRGRLLLPDDDRPGAHPVAVVAAGFANRQFDGVDEATGQSLLLNGRSVTIVGVIDDRQGFPEGRQIWTSMPRAVDPSQRTSRSLTLIGALKTGVAPDAARRDLDAVSVELGLEFPGGDGRLKAVVLPLREMYLGDVRPAFAALAGAAALLLLIACFNVASMQLARAAGRAQEMAARVALGAGRGRLIRLVLTENVLLALIGSAGGVALAAAASTLVVGALPVTLASWMAPELDGRVLAAAVAIAMVTGVVFGLAPALRLAGVAPAQVLHGGRGVGGRRRLAVHRGLVSIEVALAMVLLVGATLAAKSFARLTEQDPGFDPAGVATFRLSLRGERYEARGARIDFTDQLLERLAALPGVEAAAAAAHAPIADCCSRFGLHVEGDERGVNTQRMITGNVVTPDYFRALRIGLIKGRGFTDADRRGAQEVMMINETFERELFGGRDAVGRIVNEGSTDVTVIGVVRDVKQTELAERAEPQFYRPQAQKAWDDLTVALRMQGGDPMVVLPAAREALRELDPTLPAYRAMPLTDLVARSVASQRVFRGLLVGTALVALVLAATGIYGLTSYYVAQRTPELGVRLALGAEPGRLAMLVIRQTAMLAAIGLVVGLAGSLLAGRGLAGLLYGVERYDPAVLAIASAGLAAAAVLACLGPLRRAMRLDPMTVLRAE